jgi:hypothetical protein
MLGREAMTRDSLTGRSRCRLGRRLYYRENGQPTEHILTGVQRSAKYLEPTSCSDDTKGQTEHWPQGIRLTCLKMTIHVKDRDRDR